MRKHFLILMLLTLLPLAGWAADLSKGLVVIPSPYYGNAPKGYTVYNEANDGLKEGTDYTFVGYFEDEDCNTPITAVNIAKKDAGTVIWAKFTGINGYENSLKGSFEIKPMPVTVTLADTYSKTFGAKDPTFVISTVVDDNKTDVTKALSSSITVTRKSGENVGTYAYEATLSGKPNYAIGTVAGNFTINAKSFTQSLKEGTDVFAKLTGTYTYTGKTQNLSIVVKDGSKVLTAGTKGKTGDYYITNTATAAGDQTVTLTGMNNYTATDIVLNFTIDAAPLLVTPASTKVYDGNTTLGKVTYSYQGFVDAKTATDVDASAASSSSAKAEKNVGKYALTVDDATKFTLANYSFIGVEGTFEITKKDLNVTADNANLNYGDAENFTVTYDDGFTADPNKTDETAIKDAIKVSKVAADKNGKNLLPEFKTDDEIDAAIDALKLDEKVAAARKAAAKQAKANYNLKATRGKLTFNNAKLNIALKESAYTLEKVYDGQPVSITLDKENGLTIIGKKNESDVINLDNLELTVVSNSANQGTYQLQLSGATADNYDITFIPSQYVIKPRPITVKVYDQVFVKGTKLNLNTTLFDIVTAKDKKGNYTQYPIADTDNAGQIFQMTTTVATDKDGIITSTSASNPFAINVADGGAKVTPKYANYAITEVAGVATVVDAAITLDDNSLVNKAGAKADEVVSVVFGSRALNAEKWNVLVLPFDIAVKDLAAAFDYAVVDVLDQTASDGNVHFKLQVTGTIPANTPFLIYPDEKYNNLNQITFIDVTVKKGAMANKTVSVADKGGNKFFGTYETTGIYGEPFRYMSKGTWYNAAKYTESSKCNIKPLRGYLDLSGSTAAAPVIYIEEPNGDVTAIETVKTERVAIENDGWYTLNGVKLQNAPTEKGIYIRNGKKFVIK